MGGEDELLHLAGLAKEAGLVTGVVRDAGRTQVGETNETFLRKTPLNSWYFRLKLAPLQLLELGQLLLPRWVNNV